MIEEQRSKEEEIQPIVKVNNLVTQFFTYKGIVKALDGVSFQIKPGEILGLVGESGCGKSVTATSIMDLIPDPPGRIISGEIYIDNFNILADLDKQAKIIVKSETKVKVKRNKRYMKRHNFIMSKIRGNKISMIFQEPSLSMNPVMKIGDQITEAILLHSKIEIANSIIRRETMSDDDLKKFYETASALKSHLELRRYVHSWAQDYGVAEAEEGIIEIIERNDQNALQELKSIVEEQKTHINLKYIGLERDYERYNELLFDLNLQLLAAESRKDENKISELRGQIKHTQSYIRSKFTSYRIIKKFIGKRIDEPFKKEARRRALELLKLVNIAGPERVIDSYPHELSGGMLQRSMIAMALSSNPKILIADEPTTALDVTTQAQILDIMKDLNRVTKTSILFITHDLAVIAEMCHRVAVMYAGNIVEEAPVKEIFKNPKHPYTVGLLKAIPRPDVKVDKFEKLESIKGSVPNLINPPSGCRFNPRCPFRMDICDKEKPKLIDIGNGHKVACFLFEDKNGVEKEAE
ncbi:ABC transport system ATP-binding protein P1P2A1A2 [Thermoplasma volcanium GSS1]|uniref:Nickel import system ATP-binding protein NikD n=1 Tax=Thermoplasma volcanium (strain ATCC 51530 / DSM 4299 / JCM 9571 / NBRC 15438 / GSS1) TaxID=273116 RepID=Q978R2_THEVO|nr:ABC transporter ATP-binding protein [Thermoplasma volcanium]BAB60495.1 ABC transport system ATP-binding protein P1P2A1A2 [Thermoplasma volcanium GSS1]